MKQYSTYESPLGLLGIAAEHEAITDIWFAERSEGPADWIEEMTRQVQAAEPEPELPVIAEARRQLEEYFEGGRRKFSLPLAPAGTEFQRRVWKALEQIPYGETRSYKEIAEAVESPKAFRAVGMANNKNPIAIVIPCHRVLGADQSLVGYGGGLDLKVSLLAMESLHPGM